MKIIIRPAQAADLPQVLHLRLEFLTEEHGDIPDTQKNAFLTQWESYFQQHLGTACRGWLAESAGEIAALALLLVRENPANNHFPNGRYGEILNVYTRPVYRRQGLAGQILQRLIIEATKENLSFLTLSATENGKPLYEKLGFQKLHSPYTRMELPLN